MREHIEHLRQTVPLAATANASTQGGSADPENTSLMKQFSERLGDDSSHFELRLKDAVTELSDRGLSSKQIARTASLALKERLGGDDTEVKRLLSTCAEVVSDDVLNTKDIDAVLDQQIRSSAVSHDGP